MNRDIGKRLLERKKEKREKESKSPSAFFLNEKKGVFPENPLTKTEGCKKGKQKKG